MQAFKQVERIQPAKKTKGPGFADRKVRTNIQRRQARAAKLRMRGSIGAVLLAIVSVTLIACGAMILGMKRQLHTLELAQKVDPSQSAVFVCEPIRDMKGLMACRILEDGK